MSSAIQSAGPESGKLGVSSQGEATSEAAVARQQSQHYGASASSIQQEQGGIVVTRGMRCWLTCLLCCLHADRMPQRFALHPGSIKRQYSAGWHAVWQVNLMPESRRTLCQRLLLQDVDICHRRKTPDSMCRLPPASLRLLLCRALYLLVKQEQSARLGLRAPVGRQGAGSMADAGSASLRLWSPAQVPCLLASGGEVCQAAPQDLARSAVGPRVGPVASAGPAVLVPEACSSGTAMSAGSRRRGVSGCGSGRY